MKKLILLLLIGLIAAAYYAKPAQKVTFPNKDGINSVIFSVAYYFKPPDKVTFPEIYPGSTADISRLYMLDGRTGRNDTTEDKQKIEQFLQLMNSLSFDKKTNQSPRTGYLYFVDLFQGETKVLRVTFAGDIQIDETYYRVDRDVMEDLETFYDSLK